MSRSTGFVSVFLLAASISHAQSKKRVAVLDFDYATVQSGVSALFGSNQDVGKGISDLLVDKLVKDGQYSVIERKALDKVLGEQNFSNSNRADSTSAAKIGKVLGVDAIIVGSITQFGRDDKKTSAGGLGAVGGRFGIGGVQHSKSQAVVGITARMINTDTAEILASVTGKGESTRSGTSLLGSGGGYGGAGAGALDMRSTNFAETLLGEATYSAVNNIGQQLDSKAATLPTKVVTISGLVADVAGDGTVIINVGSQAGVKVGDRLEIAHKVREVRDPSTGKVIRRVEDRLGDLTITEVDEQSSVGKFSGPRPPSVGDTVKSQAPHP
jgi:curli biogenesis system outer membrane secretion channel CsgG